MSVKNILNQLSLLDIKLNVVDGNIDIMIPKNGTLPQELLIKIKENKPQLIAYIQSLQQQQFSVIAPVPEKEYYEVSSAQRRLWVLSQIDEASVAYNIPVVYNFKGALNLECFREAFKAIIQRHESLRTVFSAAADGDVQQLILPEEKINFVIETDDLSEGKPGDDLTKKINHAIAKPFDIIAGPLMRACLYKTGQSQHVFVFVIHHLVSDAWSLNVLVPELLSLYNAFVKGNIHKLPELTIQYKDYAAWQQNQLKGETAKAHKVYWLDKFKGELPVLELQGQKKRPSVKTYNGELITRHFDPAVQKELIAFTRKNGGTLFMGLMASVKALLFRYTGQQDLVLGTAAAGRDHADLEGQIGFYVNTLPIRTQFKGEESFEQLFEHTKAAVLGAFEHQMFPFDELVDELNIARDRSRSPLFDIMVSLQNAELKTAAGRQMELDGLTVSTFETANTTSIFDLLFNFYEGENGLSISLEYNSDIYSQDFAEQLVKHLERLIAALLKDPSISVASVVFLDAEEQKQQLLDFNPSFIDHVKSRSIVQLFEEQAAANPKKTAVIFEENNLTYAALNKLADQFAHYLSDVHHVSIENVVGVKLQRDEWMMVVILGILKCGAAYLPVDLKSPEDRIDYILNDSGCAVVVDEKMLNDFKAQMERYSSIPPLNIQPENLAYVIYTSGTTGLPKGVLIEHKSVIRLVKSPGFIQLDNKKTVLVTGAATFDSVTFEYWSMLLNGGTVVLATKEDLMQAYTMKFLIEEHKVNIMWLTSSWFNEIINEDRSVFKSLDTLLVGGDRLSAAHINSLRESYPHIQVINGYGPTENTTFSLCHTISEKYDHEIPIGKPIANSTAYILDAGRKLLPVGACGEIYVGGDGLARAYLNRRELTEEKFVDHPFLQNEKLYRTGDLGRWRADGTMEFMGRADSQVKIRGFRIELGEIENTLLQHDKVEQVIITTAEGNAGKILLCYFVSRENPEIAELRGYLKQKLPAYMLPAHFTQLDKMPLTPNGKIDKHALPAPEGSSGPEYIAPRNKLENRVAELWSQVLSVEKISVHDDFFELGGHSLRAIRLINLYAKELDAKVTIAGLFEHTTLEKHVALIRSSSRTMHHAIEKAEEQDFYALSSAQKRLLFLQEFAPDNASYNITEMNYLGKEVDKSRIAIVLKKLIERHESLRTVFIKKEGGAYQRILGHVPFELEEYECTLENVKEFMDGYSRPFDLGKAPLLRSAIVHIKEVGYIWIAVLHHIITDGTSQEVLVDDFFRLYNGEELPPLKLQYRDFSEWQNKLIENGGLDLQKEYWKKQFTGNIPVLNLPADRPRPAVFSFEGGVHRFSLKGERAAALHELGKRFGGTLQISILSLLNVLFHKYSGAADIVIGCSIAGRHHSDLERIIGMFVNSLPVRNFPQGEKSFADFYEEVKAGNLAAYDNQAVQFEDLVNMLNVKRDPARNPVFDVSLVVQNFERSAQHSNNELYQMAQDEEILSQFAPEWNTSKFDMTWAVMEQQDEIIFNLEYYAAIFNLETILGFVSHFETILDTVAANPAILIENVNLLRAGEESHIIQRFCHGEKLDYPSQSTLHGVFEQQAKQTPEKAAVRYEAETLTYKELDDHANRLACFLNGELHIKPEARVGILQRRSKALPASLMAVLKAGGAYVPLDPDYPEDRLLYMLEDAGIEVLLTEKSLVEFANKLQWRARGLKHIVCVDTDDYFSERGGIRNELMEKDLWDHVGRTAKNVIAGGGWMSSYTGEDMSGIEMKEYADNAYLKLKKYLHPGMKVLEIGCSSGLTMFRMAPEVGSYYGTDLSAGILENTKAEAKRRKQENIQLHCMPAHEIDQLGEHDFDLVIINSVIHCFDGHNYLRDVLCKAIALLGKKGMLFLGDLMDEEKRNGMIADLVDFKQAHPQEGLRTKTDWSAELFVSRAYFHDLQCDGIGITAVGFSDKIHTVSNELTKYRYDALLEIDKESEITGSRSKEKYQHGMDAVNAHSAETLRLPVSSSALAYVIYTSGSTGKPKGVMVEHRSVLNYITWAHAYYNDGTAGDVQFGLFTSLSFDLTVTSIYMSLLTGGTLRIFDPAAELMDVLKSYLHDQGTENFIKLTPSHIRLIDTMSLEKTKIRYAIAGGEELHVNHIAALKKLNPAMNIYNEYGPTEATVGCIVWKAAAAENPVLIGRPLANTSVYILDAAGKIVPPGIAGEICIGGDGLARGYLNRPELTAEKFIVNPYAPAQLIYKTGDLGRFLQNAEIEYLGRSDDQVKIRGYRMELGEIARALLAVKSVKDATVIVKELEEDEKTLVAYVVTDPGTDPEFIRESLKEALPANMIPSYFVQMDALPLTINGKIDKRALPEPAVEIAVTDNDRGPSTEMEEKVLAIWQKVLGKIQIGMDADFFALGGHSLRVMKLIGLYEKELKVKLTLSALFEHRTIGAQAALISTSAATGYAAISKTPAKKLYHLSSAQKRLYFLHELTPASTSYNMPVAEYLGTDIEKDKMEAALEKLIERHESLRTSFKKTDGTVYQQIHEKVNFKLDYHECTAADFREYVNAYVRPFDLAKAPLLRAGLVKVEGAGFALIVDEHHIISDGVSHELLVNEFMALYQGQQLPELRLQYKDYSEWQNGLVFSAELYKQRAYWESVFTGGIPKLNLPADRQRPAVFNFEGDRIGFTLDKTTTAQLHELGREYAGTLQMTLLSVLNTLLYRYTGQEDIVVGCGIAGRHHADLEGIYGMFVNSLAFRNRPSGDKSFEQFYDSVKTTCLLAYENQDIQFDDLVDLLKIERDSSRNPLFDVLLVVQNYDQFENMQPQVFGSTADINAEVLEQISYINKTAKFDLTFHIWELNEEIYVSIEYYSAIFDRSTVERLGSHFRQVITEVLGNPKVLLSDVNILPEKEKEFILDNFVYGPDKKYPGSSVHKLFADQCSLTPDNIAITGENGSLTYRELEARSNQLANFLYKELALPQEAKVGVLQTRSISIAVSFIGILKAGGAYVPMDVEFPAERLLYMLHDAEIEILLVERAFVGLANHLLWRSGSLKHIVCIDSYNIYIENGGINNQLMQKDLWDHVGNKAVDAITAGGWLSSYTGEPISEAEMEEYSNNAFLKLKKHLHKDLKVLEIGCSSGLTMFQVAPEVKSYYGTDLSSSILERTAKEAEERGQKNVFLTCMPAHEIHQLGEDGFDLVIINSVIQCFEGHNYLRDVLLKATALLKEKGMLFLGDLMDEDKRTALIGDLKKFKAENSDKDYKTKTDWSNELFVSRDYFKDLVSDDLGITELEFSDKIFTIPNELTLFRYDALLKVDKSAPKRTAVSTRQQHDLRKIDQQHTSIEERGIKPDNLCYVMYTSGSTGQPKGVLITHGGVIRLVKDAEYVQLNGSSCLLATGATTFDAITFELWGMLLNGGRLILASKNTLLDPHSLKAMIAAEKVNTMWFTAGWLNELVDSDPGIFTGLRYILAGGDKLSVKHIAKLKQLYPDLQIINGYGPTENTTFSLTYKIENTDRENFPIGTPLNNSSVFILDQKNKILPVGIPGEIILGGQGLARAYQNNQELTEEKFFINPYNISEKLYRSGDLGRWLPDGNIEFIGRKDDQVKIRGYRIELGEVENCLLSKPYIENAVVLVESKEEKQLVAYIISSDPAMDTLNLVADLAETLPAYMIPARFVKLPAFPLNKNGKVDRHALAASGQEEQTSGYVEPSTLLEKQLAEIWQDILGVSLVGVNDDFFKIGGHSLKAISLVSSYSKKFNTKIPLKDIFEKTTIAEQSILIENATQQVYNEIPAAQKQDSYPLSNGQRRLWLLSRFSGGSVAYNMPFSTDLYGNYNIDHFIMAINDVIDRHESLRTTFLENEDGEIRQYIHKKETLDFCIEFNDLRRDENRKNEVYNYIAKDALVEFDLEKGPLFRARIMQLEDKHFVFSFNMHHIISDGVSIEVMSKEVTDFYDAYQKNIKAVKAPLRIQYKDYAVWQNEQLSNGNFTKHKEYWLQLLKGELPALDLPFAKKRPLVKTYNGESLSLLLPEGTSQELKRFCSDRKGSLFMGLLATVKILLYRYTNQEDLLVGSPFAGRDHKDLDGQIGFYVNTIVLRNRLNGKESLDSIFEKVKNNVVDAFTHQAYPYDKLLDELNVKRDTGRNPGFDIMVSLANVGGDLVNVAGDHRKAGEIADHGTVLSKFDLDISFQETDNNILFSIEFNADIFEKAAVKQLMTHYVQLLGNMLRQPEQPVGQVELLSSAEKMKLLTTFNSTAVNYSTEKMLTTLFEEQVLRSPDKTAVEFGLEKFTYRELNESANQFAAYLKSKHNVNKGDMIGLQFSKTGWIVPVIIGILKSGAVYVPIDPEYPAERIGYMVEECNCKVSIDEAELLQFLKERHLYKNVNVSVNYTGSDIMLVLYTSGSTGRPKGVVLQHSAVLHYILHFKDYFKLNENDRFIQQASLSFDTHLDEIFPSLLAGATVLIAMNGGRDIPGLKELFEKHDATVISTTPLVINELNSPGVSLNKLRMIISGGESLQTEHISHFAGHIEIYNTYGPSEATVCASFYKVIDKSGSFIPIGYPIANTNVYILNDELELLPAGIVGEICISGNGLAKEYWNQPGLTAEKFVINPFDSERRMYRTGDLGRWLEDGSIQFIGRKDRQFKIRGYRMEAGEIENTIRSHPGIENVYVDTFLDASGIRSLVAYITGKNQPDPEALRVYLSRQVPFYMVPAHIIQLTAFPLTVNGKLDTKLLPVPDLSVLQSQMVDPRTKAEEKMTELWKEVLDLEKIGVKDNFFELGGSSIKAVKLQSIIKRKLNIELKLISIYDNPTIEKLCLVSKQSPVIKLNSVSAGMKHNMYFVPPVFGNSVVYQPLAKTLENKFNCYGLQFRGLEQDEHFPASIEEMAQELANDILLIQSGGEASIAGYSMGANIAFEIVKLLEGKFDKLTLVLFDKEVQKNKMPEIPEITLHEEVNFLASKYAEMFNDESLVTAHFKKFLSNNIRILNKHNIQGTVSSDIIAFEAMDSEFCTKMKNWKKHTKGDLMLHLVKGDHWELVAEHAVSQYKNPLHSALQKNRPVQLNLSGIKD